MDAERNRHIIALPVLSATEGRSCNPSPATLGGYCAKLAQEADQKDQREFYIRMRDCWVTVANRFAFFDIIDEHGTPPHCLPLARDATPVTP
jgi:hypothetical protein